jgi:beta-glucuronidase
MNKPSRRDLLKQLGTAGVSAALATPLASAAQPNVVGACPDLATAVIPLERWSFALDSEAKGESQGWFKSAKEGPTTRTQVLVPHTWQVATESADYMGFAWYWTEFDAPARWAELWVRIEFEAVFHTARVWLNGKFLGEHSRDGYTAFTLDATPALRFDGTNFLAVQVDNSFRDDMLPRNDSYDWAQDGGITRPVSLLVTPRVFIHHVGVVALPDLDSGQTSVNISAGVRWCGVPVQPVTIGYSIGEGGSGVALATVQKAAEVSAGASGDAMAQLSPINVPLKLWHFDHPHFYRAVVTINAGDKPVHSCSTVFGSRKFEVKGTAFHLNGERVRLMGVERMAGSNPDYGMAEPSSWITHDHDDLKELNCVFTRVHWQQDKRVLDYCDRHGILIQEEVPSWGGATFSGMTNEPSAVIMENGLKQLREMITRDRNHPCIVSWGLCNEVNGHNPVSRAFIQQMAAEARRMDPHRLLSYASNSLQKTPGEDAAGLLDFIAWNQYYGSWYPGDADSVRRNLQEIHAAFPDKPVVISEYGYCECKPDRLGGDERRIEIIRSQTQACREFDFVAGTIFFDYNDYRTHIGDKGVGPLKQRVHGVVDLYGNRKPSFEALRQEASPVESLLLATGHGSLTATVTTRQTLPAYTLEGYKLRWLVFGFDDLPMEESFAALPRLFPGQQFARRFEFQEKQPKRVRVDVVRPTGFSAATAWWKSTSY